MFNYPSSPSRRDLREEYKNIRVEFQEGDLIKNINTGEERRVESVTEVDWRIVYELDNGVRFNTDYQKCWKKTGEPQSV